MNSFNSPKQGSMLPCSNQSIQNTVKTLSHHRLAHADGRRTTVAVHGNSPLPIGTMHKIIREDIGLDNNSFHACFEQFNQR
ncbi:MAG: addiction module toxin, HicA family [Candidatus Kapaibacterium sp.]|nr:MAG: addiction module toxin, HicA family [Candidatus Kapabacteria bacterium]